MYYFNRLALIAVFIFSMSNELHAEPVVFVDLANTNSDSGTAIYPYLQPSICENIDLTVSHVPRNKCIRDRIFGSTGDKIVVYVKHKPDTEIKIGFEEKVRNTVIRDNLDVVIKILNSVLAGAAAQSNSQGAPSYEISKFPYTLTRSRAVLTITVESQLVKDEIKFESITGPKEHWFLSADMLVTESNQLKYDLENSELVERTKPSEFFLGANYMLGDVLNDQNTFLENLYVKGFVNISSRPLDSYGVGLGFRFNKVGSVFIAYNRFLEDADPEGSSVRNEKYGDSVGVGLSLDLNSALNWLK